MCGICGIALKEGSITPGILDTMTDIMRHRGPDDRGIMVRGRIGLGHRRLSIIDLASGHQPMSNEDGSVSVAYNGEIYNYREIRAALQRSGHVFRTASDTESLIHLYEEKALSGIADLRGMFAYALWDSSDSRLYLVRDRLGVKPLYYACCRGNLVWASEIKAILASGMIEPKVRMESLPEYLANRYVSGEFTLFEDIRRVPPGCYLTWKDGKTRLTRYWDVPEEECDTGLSGKEMVAEFSRLFEESVRLRLVSDVPLGLFLSGGIDSSAIAAVMSRLTAEPVKTFSVAFEDRAANELAYARAVAEKFRTDHREVTVSPRAFFEKLPRLIWHEDEPIAFPSSVPLYFVSELAARDVKVVLTGEGSDELMAGYARYLKTLWNLRLGKTYCAALPQGLRSEIARGLRAAPLPPRAIRKLERTFLMLRPDLESLYHENFSAFNRHRIAELLQARWRGLTGTGDPYRIQLELCEGRKGALLNRLLYADIKTYLQELLMKQDQMSMAASIESRVPFLDHKLVEFVAALPPRMKIRLGSTKYLLRKAMKGILPDSIITRGKMGFPVPIARWFRDGTCRDLQGFLLGDRARDRNYFSSSCIERLLNEHRSGLYDHSERIWSLLNFEWWNRIFIDQEKVSADEEKIAQNLMA